MVVNRHHKAIQTRVSATRRIHMLQPDKERTATKGTMAMASGTTTAESIKSRVAMSSNTNTRKREVTVREVTTSDSLRG
jgi:hypothetical protein